MPSQLLAIFIYLLVSVALLILLDVRVFSTMSHGLSGLSCRGGDTQHFSPVGPPIL